MRLARKRFLLAAMALAALALTATTANAQIEVLDEETDDHCSAVTVVNDHDVTGGCHVEFKSLHDVPLVLTTAGGPVTLSNCLVHMEGHINETGSGYIDTVALTDEVPPANPPCTRTPCDEAADAAHHPHAELLWPVSFTEVSGVELVETTFCLRPSANAEGVGNTFCEVHLPWADKGGHNYEIGAPTGIYSCENLPPVSIRQAHFVNETAPESGTEDVEIIH